MAKLALYVDSSVVGGLIDEEPRTRKSVARAFFEQLEEGALFEAYMSQLVVDEVMRGPERLKNAFAELTGRVEFRVLGRSAESEELADNYVSKGVIPGKQRNDALHLAAATVARLDVVVSWNFRHMVNVARIRGVNGVNLIAGYPQIDVRSPEEVLGETE